VSDNLCWSAWSVCCLCDERGGHERPQLSVLRDGCWNVVCLKCWSKEPVWRRSPATLPPKSKWRWRQRLYALMHGYFWIPCPTCGQMFGGHEDGGFRYNGGGSSLGTCPSCKTAQPDVKEA